MPARAGRAGAGGHFLWGAAIAIKRSYPEHPLVGVLAVVRRGDRVLLVQRKNPPNQGLWGFPGGLQDVNETLAEGALRELREETGVAARAIGPLTALDAIQRDVGGRAEYHFTLVAILLEWVSGEGEADDDASAVRWLSLKEMKSADVPLIRNVEDVARLALKE